MVYLNEAIKELAAADVTIVEESSVYETAPLGPQDQGWYLNAVLEVATSDSPSDLLAKILEIERLLGRIRKQRWGERCIDIDILYYQQKIIDSQALVVPHPEIANRKFVLTPMVEIAPWFTHPVRKRTQTELLAMCSDHLDCRRTEYQLL